MYCNNSWLIKYLDTKNMQKYFLDVNELKKICTESNKPKLEL